MQPPPPTHPQDEQQGKQEDHLDPASQFVGRRLDDLGAAAVQDAADRRAVLGVHPRQRYALFLGVADDFRDSPLAPGRLAVPDGDDRVGSVHDVAPGSLVGLVAGRRIRGLPDIAGLVEEAAELSLRVFGSEVLDVVLGGQRQRHLEPGILLGP